MNTELTDQELVELANKVEDLVRSNTMTEPRGLIHVSRLHLGIDDTQGKVIPFDVSTNSPLVLVQVSEEISRRKKESKEKLFGKKVVSTPDGTVPEDQFQPLELIGSGGAHRGAKG
jgi:hypothetical protein